MDRFIPKISLIFPLLFLLVCCSGTNRDIPDKIVPAAKEGRIDLSNWDFEKQGITGLDGQWYIYPGLFLNREDIKSGRFAHHKKVTVVPDGFDNKFFSEGYVTYHLQVRLPRTGFYSLEIKDFYTASTIFVNNIPVLNAGVPAKNKQDCRSYTGIKSGRFYTASQDIDIIIHVSNFHSMYSGIWDRVELGLPGQITGRFVKKSAADAFFIGAILILGIYQLLSFLFRKENKESLYFSLSCLFAIVYSSVVGQRVLYFLIPQLPWTVYLKLLHLSSCAGVLSFTLYVDAVFPDEPVKFLLRFIQIVFPLSLPFLLFFPERIGELFFIGIQAIILFFVLYIIVICALALKRRRSGAVSFSAGYIVFGVATFADIVTNNLFPSIGEKTFIQVGLFLFICFQLIVLGRRNARKHREVELLSVELEAANAGLEKKVKARTAELAAKNRQLKVTMDELQYKNDQIFSSIRYAERIQSAILPPVSIIREFFADSFLLYKPRDIVGGDLYWFRENRRGLLVIIGDCTGHGIPGAFMVMTVNTLISKINDEDIYDNPALLLAEMNRMLKRTLKQDDKTSISSSDDGADLGICFIPRDKSHLLFAGAKLSLYYVKDGIIHEVPGDHKSIGYKESSPGETFINHTIHPGSSTVFYLTTDGYLDQIGGPCDIPFGRKNFKKVLPGIQNRSMEEQKELLKEEFNAYKKNERQVDDITILGFRI